MCGSGTSSGGSSGGSESGSGHEISQNTIVSLENKEGYDHDEAVLAAGIRAATNGKYDEMSIETVRGVTADAENNPSEASSNVKTEVEGLKNEGWSKEGSYHYSETHGPTIYEKDTVTTHTIGTVLSKGDNTQVVTAQYFTRVRK